jgi:Gpi18-like mannosyltransferase
VDAANAPTKALEARRPIPPALLLLAAGAVYGVLWPAVPGDINNFLIPWLDHILANGPVGAFATPFSNYTPSYLYLLTLVSPLVAVMSKVSVIKSLSVAGTAALALAVRWLLRSLEGNHRSDAWLWLPLLPSVAVNASIFAQCDAIWSAACIMAVASAVRERPLSMLAWFGVAIAFKAQGLFLGPFVALCLVQSRTPLRFWVTPVLIYALAMLPAALAGWPVRDLSTIYLRQAEWNPAFVSTAANPWSMLQHLGAQSAQRWFWLGYVAAAAAPLAYVAAYRRRSFSKGDMIAAALLGSCLMPFFLPKMHERFFFLSEVLAFALAFSEQDRRSMKLFWLVQAAWALAMASAMFDVPLLGTAGAAAILSAMLLLVNRLRSRSAETKRDSSGATALNPSEQKQDYDDDQDQAKEAGRSVTPTAAVAPAR